MQARASGVLLPVFSLPGPYGVGTFGTPAREFVDFLAAGGQKFWQILPLVPPGGGNSPYMSPSSFAGNPLFLDLDELAEEGLLTAEELDSARRDKPDRVDYPWLLETRIPLLRKAWARGRARYARELAEFLEAERSWLPDYALFLALRDRFDGKPLADWPDELRLRKQSALEKARAELKEACDFHAFLQLLFFRQWTAVKAYANGKGISIIGDLPIYVSPDSAEVWARPELFQLKEDMTPAGVAGVPPDAFSDKGQHWGNPLYDWDYHRKTGFAWWRSRAVHLARLYDVVRIDHFRGFHTYWCIPDGAEDAREGHWEKGPGMELVEVLRAVPGLALIAEDLGDLDENALRFIAESGLPGMKVLVYAFDPNGESAYLPHICAVAVLPGLTRGAGLRLGLPAPAGGRGLRLGRGVRGLDVPLPPGHRPSAGSAGPGGRRPGQCPRHLRRSELELAGAAGGPQPRRVRPPGPYHPHLPEIGGTAAAVVPAQRIYTPWGDVLRGYCFGGIKGPWLRRR